MHVYCFVISFDYPFIAYFLKKKYSLRQNILKNLRVWERSLTSVPIGVYLDLIWVGTWLGIGSAEEHWRFTGKEWPDAASDSAVQHPVSSQEVNSLRRSDRTLRFSVQSVGGSASGRAWRRSRQGDRTLAMSRRGPSDTSGRDSRGLGPLWNRPDAGWQRPVAATEASDQ